MIQKAKILSSVTLISLNGIKRLFSIFESRPRIRAAWRKLRLVAASAFMAAPIKMKQKKSKCSGSLAILFNLQSLLKAKHTHKYMSIYIYICICIYTRSTFDFWEMLGRAGIWPGLPDGDKC